MLLDDNLRITVIQTLIENSCGSCGWCTYQSEKEDKEPEITEGWKGETDGILVFTGLFSVTVAAFTITIESYKQLSPDSGVTTNALVTHISQQLINNSNGTPLASVAAQISRPFKPTASVVRVNELWFLSLVISLKN
ncbi:hypothetical protein EDB85DRAFT_788326 [Lactarius pseudohatsudake]|nr:hypothetical protein EDB85DRAFT_788326 [Lactarius pseudohatsudake]